MLRSDQILEAEPEAFASTQDEVRGSYIGLIAIVAAITMLFAALSSAYIVRRGLSSDWTPVGLPHVVWASPLALILGSAMLERRRGRVAARIMPAVLGLITGLIIVESWRELAKVGVSAASNAGAAFFYVFSAGFLICLTGGVVALLRSGSRIRDLYWHYLSGLWSWLLLLMKVWQ